jgi:hypothetical protein
VQHTDAPRTSDIPLSAQAQAFEQLGLFDRALRCYRLAFAEQPDDAEMVFRFTALLRSLQPADACSDIRVIWRTRPEDKWEREWVGHLLSGLKIEEMQHGAQHQVRDRTIIIDDSLTPERTTVYRELFDRGLRFGILHLGDEFYASDYECYRYANFIIRNYWSPYYAHDRRVLTVPLGLTNGFAPRRMATAQRSYVWSFLGAINKGSRIRMMDVMANVPGGYTHTMEGVPSHYNVRPYQSDDKNPVAITEYAEVMSRTLFAPSPMGWINLDSFRVYEALEAGCIPIVERRPGLDYFTRLLGRHPMPSVVDWAEAPALIAELMATPERLDALRCSCESWWQRIRRDLVSNVAAHVQTYLAPIPAGLSIF